MNDELLSVQSQSIRNNIVFNNIEEARSEVTENADTLVCEF